MAKKLTQADFSLPGRGNPFGVGALGHIAPTLTEVSNLASVCDNIMRSGCGIMLSHTRDGGALVVTILDGDERYKQYAGNQGELERLFDSLNAAYEL